MATGQISIEVEDVPQTMDATGTLSRGHDAWRNQDDQFGIGFDTPMGRFPMKQLPATDAGFRRRGIYAPPMMSAQTRDEPHFLPQPPKPSQRSHWSVNETERHDGLVTDNPQNYHAADEDNFLCGPPLGPPMVGADQNAGRAIRGNPSPVCNPVENLMNSNKYGSNLSKN